MSTDELRMDRRKFLGGAAGLAGVAALGSWAPGAFSRPGGPNSPIVTKATMSAQHFSVRDATGRLDKSVMGYLGGPNFPEDPTDLGPLVPLPGGFAAVFQYLAEVGYTGFEFFGYTQAAGTLGGRQPTTAEIRSYLDAAGMRSVGTHTGGLGMTNATTRATQLDIANVLGHKMIGTAGDPVTGANASLLSAWQTACDQYNQLGELMYEQYGIKVYLHAEQNNWQFFNDPAHPELARKHRIDFFTENTDPRYVFFEPDVYHTYNARGRFPDPVDGSLWDAEGWIKNNWKRMVGWHIKDANRSVPAPAPPGNPFSQTMTRAGFPINNGVDAIYSTEGHLGKGYPFDPGATAPAAKPGPDPTVIGFKRLFTETRSYRGKGYLHHIVETDSGIGGAADQGRSLRHAKVSARLLLGLK
ncbi:sugar phosphate isomerase/epimerase family protein [Solirubrobacter soli]|uniref:sugar phosphate isomerase/epimerase family protein n=1 Tax=Solirubrobacter soli TaxID=363832 RepID=UPI000408D2AE|nr:TIM barrel protein [Solirubrobacter soli]